MYVTRGMLFSERKTVRIKEQIISKGKYPSMFLKSSGGYCVYYHSKFFCNMCSFENQRI